MNWNAAVARAIGSSHRQTGRPCQDFVQWRLRPDGIAVGAVSDGAGSARHAHLASKLVAQLTVQHLALWDLNGDTPDEHLVAQRFRELVRSLALTIRGGAGIWHSASRDWACTLIAFLASPRFLLAMQIGDGFAVIRKERSPDYELLFAPQHGEYVNQTVFVIDKDAPERVQVRVIPEPVAFVCGSTDGLERLALDLRTTAPHRAFFMPFEETMKHPPPAADPSAELEKYLASPKVDQRTDDDRSLILLARAGQTMPPEMEFPQ